MDIKDLQSFLVSRSKGWFPHVWEQSKHDLLLYNTIAIAGEVGEFANKIKKYMRAGEEHHLIDAAEELADVFAYMLILCEVLDIDLEAELLAKAKKNEQRFHS